MNVLATVVDAIVVDVLAVVKHRTLDEMVTRPLTVRLELTRMRCVVERELISFRVLYAENEVSTNTLFRTDTVPTVDALDIREAAWITERLDCVKWLPEFDRLFTRKV